MPHLRFRGVQAETVQRVSEQAQELERIVKTPADHFTFEHVTTQFFTGGQTTNAYPFVEVLWFARVQQQKNDLALFLTNLLKDLESGSDVCVVFFDLSPESYFENGSHF